MSSLQAQRSVASRRWLDRAIRTTGTLSAVLAAATVLVGSALCYWIVYALGGASSASPTWFIPMILIAAARFRYSGAIVAAVIATLLAGPMLPIDVDAGTHQSIGLWTGRGFVFLFVGVVTAALIDRIVADRERELALAEQERDLAVRQAAVIATVSHEFRTPLTVITGVARTLEIQDMVDAEGIPLLGGLVDATRRLTDLVNTVGAVLDDAGSDSFVRRESIILREVLDHVCATLGVRDAASRLSFRIDPDAEIFVSDRELLAQLLRHVIENAVKFSPSDCRVEVNVDREGEKLCVHVLDRGAGISEELLRSPGPFLPGDPSLTRTTQGLGLGLFAATRLAAALGGSLRFLPRPGGGTDAVIALAAPDSANA